MAVERTAADEKSRTTLIIVVAAVAAIIIGGLFYWLMRKSAAPSPPVTLQAAIRPGSSDWDNYVKRIALDDPEADESKRALGDTVMNLFTTVRNFTGRTITGLEMRGSVVDHDGKAIKQRTMVMIPGRQPELDPNKTMRVTILMDGFSDEDDRANIKMEVTGFTLR